MTPFLIVGLGNPGEKYADTRHNLGFQVIDELARRLGKDSFSSKFRSHLLDGEIQSKKVILLKPQTYMNLSGEAVRAVSDFYKLPAQESLLVIVDDLDLPTGRLRLRKAGSAGGHNGLKSIIEHLGRNDFWRIRIGIGRGAGVTDHVLGKMGAEEKKTLHEAIQNAADAIQVILKEGMDKAMNQFNVRGETDEP